MAASGISERGDSFRILAMPLLTKFMFSDDWKIDLYRPQDLPPLLKVQILSFYRCLWPWGFKGKDQYRDWITGQADAPQHLVIHHEDTLISALCIVSRTINFWGQSRKIAGFTGVLVYPNFQKKGVGLKLLERAIEIAEKDFSVICLHCDPDQVSFYEKSGFSPLRELKVMEGDPQNPTLNSGVMMIKSQDDSLLHQLKNPSQPLYFGPYTW